MNRFSAPNLRNSRSGGRAATARPRDAARLQTLARRYGGCPNAAHGHHRAGTDVPHGQVEV
ncbi:hypothetical protein [Geodermatophilus poikilotrophus]|uniref:Uncharacterized protein n=1 Tax=Geodermatophilus poikilotrophus TaxID=1333667 RepID=A0A1H9YX14_9ACTN|nr:hypothetical protein [Geodermatophilus poikilotrophus]SES73690.1 hypothetical protein SAMN04488546_0320 [Geodermatophilus poikilotrophus]